MDIRMSNIASPMPQIRAKFTNKLGIPLSGCKVYTYEPNSNIPKKTWIDIDKTVENTNPILLDSAGEADIFLDGLYRIVVKDRFGFVVYDVEKTGSAQQQINDFTGNYWYAKPLGYELNARVMLTNGDIVQSTIANNTTDPNNDLAGWVLESVKTVQDHAFIITPQMFGAKGDGVTDDYDAFFKCFNALPQLYALNIYIPPAQYKISKTLFITRPHKISGPSGSEAVKSILDFNGSVVSGLPLFKGALWIYHNNTTSQIPLPSGQVGSYGAGARIEGVAVFNSPEHGIVVNAPATVSDCRASANTKSGVVIVGGGVSGGNANHSIITHTKCTGNGNSGIYIDGTDANAFTIIGCETTANAHYGINDGSLLGGIVLGCESDSNGLAAYNQRGGPADNSGSPETPSRTVWVGNYAEPNQPYTYSLNNRSTVLGATGALPEAGNGYMTSSLAGMFSAKTLAVAATEQRAYDETQAFGKLGAGLLKLGWASVAQKFQVTYDGVGYINIGTNAGLGNPISLRVGTNFNNAITIYRPYFPNGFALSSNHAQTATSAAPTTGSYERGHIVWNTNPVAGGFAGWICVAAGSPGTWKTFGAISA